MIKFPFVTKVVLQQKVCLISVVYYGFIQVYQFRLKKHLVDDNYETEKNKKMS